MQPGFPKCACELIFASEKTCELNISKFGGLWSIQFFPSGAGSKWCLGNVGGGGLSGIYVIFGGLESFFEVENPDFVSKLKKK